MTEAMTVNAAIEEYSYAVLRLSPQTQKWYAQKLAVFGTWCEEQGITLDKIKATHLRAFTEYLKTRTNSQTGKPLSTYTQHGYTQVVKGFLNWCSKEDGIEDIVSSKLASKVPMTKVEIKVIEIFTPEQIRALIEASKNEYNQELVMRDRAIISVLADTGIRANELCTLILDMEEMSTNSVVH